jgi:hypothetical protein
MRDGGRVKAWTKRIMRKTRRLTSRLKRALRTLRRAPPAVRIIVAVVVLAVSWLVLNGAYQVLRKPTELFFPISGTLSKAPAETWRRYAPLFRAHSTPTMTPEFLAALAQVEGAGNPVARTPWRSQPSWNPFKWYRPASSAVGMYQVTDGTFAEAHPLENFGNLALDLILKKQFGRLVSIHKGFYDSVSIESVTSEKKVVDVPEYYNTDRLRPIYDFDGAPLFIMTND